MSILLSGHTAWCCSNSSFGIKCMMLNLHVFRFLSSGLDCKAVSMYNVILASWSKQDLRRHNVKAPFNERLLAKTIEIKIAISNLLDFFKMRSQSFKLDGVFSWSQTIRTYYQVVSVRLHSEKRNVLKNPGRTQQRARSVSTAYCKH